MHRWLCKCDCGNETVVGQTLHQSGKTQSCGCLKEAYPEYFGWTKGTSVCLLEHFKDVLSSRNTSGFNGMYQNKNGKWIAQMTFQGKTQYLGSFNNKKDAAKARKKAEERIDEFLDEFYRLNPQWREKSS